MNNGNTSNPIIVGRVVTDVRYECKGTDRVATFRLSDDSKSDSTLWHFIVSRGRQADVCKQYLHVGDLCCIEGTYNSSGDAIIADRVTFLKNKG
jgi:Single-stranded DNA-binding protein